MTFAQLPPPETSAEEARDIADQVLSGRAYAEAARPPPVTERALTWIGDQISDFFGSLSTSGGRGIMSLLMLIGFGALIIWLVAKVIKGVGTLPVRQADPDLVIDIVEGRSGSQWLKQAEEAEAAGDWRMGIRHRHRALVAVLIRRRLVSDEPGQTAGDIEQLVTGARPATAESMRDLTWLFKDVWYGWLEADRNERDRFVALSEEVLKQTEANGRTVVSPDLVSAGTGPTQ